jgi:hypothetical protein
MWSKNFLRLVLALSVVGGLVLAQIAIGFPGGNHDTSTVAASDLLDDSESDFRATPPNGQDGSTSTVREPPVLPSNLGIGFSTPASIVEDESMIGVDPTTTTEAATTSTAAPKPATTKPKPTTTPTTAPPSGPTTTSPGLPADAIRIAPGQSIQAAVNANPANTAFVIASGVHQRQEISPKNGNRFVGESGAVLDGEKSTRHAFASNASGVIIEGLIIRNYTNPIETGAVGGGSGWTVRGNEIAYNKGAGVFASGGWTVANNHIHHNGQIGILATGNSITISGNEISHNNTDGHDSHWRLAGPSSLARGPATWW